MGPRRSRSSLEISLLATGLRLTSSPVPPLWPIHSLPLLKFLWQLRLRHQSQPPQQLHTTTALERAPCTPTSPISSFKLLTTLITHLELEIVIIIILLTKILSWILAKVKQPAVIAEVITGIVLGPTVMGRIPNFTNTIFPKANMAIFGTFAEVGLVLFMNLVGLELDFALMAGEWKSTAIISVVGIALPMAVSVGSSYAVWDAIDKNYPSTKNKTFGTYVLFMAVAMSVTAFPVLARIVKEKQLFKTRIGTTTLAVAAWDDVAAWILLALSVSLVTGGGKYDALWTFLLLIGFAVTLLLPVRIGLRKLLVKKDGEPVEITTFLFALYLVCVFGSSWLTEYFGLHSIFGAFLFGLVLPRDKGFAQKLAEKFEDFTTTFFLPLYFTASGLRTQLGLLSDGNTWGLLLLVTSIAITTKVAGGCFAAKISGMSWRESFTLGILMNTKGLVELIVLNIGLDNKLISPTTFSMMVVMALVTTFLTAPFVHYLYPYHRIVEFENQTPGKTVLFGYLRHRNQVPSLLGVFSLVAKGRPKKYKMLATRTASVQERPSAYMSEENKDEITRKLDDTATILGVKVKSVDLTISNESEQEMVSQLATLSAAKNADFVFAVWKPQAGERALGGFSVQKLLNEDRFKRNLCVLMDRGLGSTELNIMFLYTGTKHDREAIKLVRAMLHTPGVHIDVVVAVDANATPDEPTNEKLLQEDAILDSLFNCKRAGSVSLTVIHSIDVNRSISNHISESEAGLIVAGSDLQWHLATKEGIIHYEIASRCQQSFLFVAKGDLSYTVVDRPSMEELITEEANVVELQDKPESSSSSEE